MHVLNSELARIFGEMADMEEIDGNRWEALAYRKVSMSILALSMDIEEVHEKGQLRSIDGVGEAIEKKITQYINERRINKYDELKKKYPIDFYGLGKIQGLGPKKIFALYSKLGVKTIEDLSEAVRQHKISSLPGFGEKSEKNISRSLETYISQGAERKPLGRIYFQIEDIRNALAESGLFQRIEIVGSIRRMRDTIGDVDILAVSNRPDEATEYFTRMKAVDHVLVSGPSKTSVVLDNGLNCDFRVFGEDSFGAAMQYFTGSKEHNIKLRDRAISLGLKLNEYGLYRGELAISGRNEQDIYRELGMSFVEPELRENTGEVEEAMRKNLPDLIPYGAVKGDMHAHTIETDGRNTLVEMVDHAVRERLSYIALTNHSKALRVASGMDGAAFSKFNDRIDRINDSQDHLRVLKGVELEIMKDGSLDLEKDTLSEMDYVLASLHQFVGQDKRENTARVISAIESGQVHAIAHPTGRLMGSRDQYPLEMDRILDACRSNSVLLEINGYPERSDLPFDLVKRARGFHVNFVLGSDSHTIHDLRFLRFATAIARRGWLESSQVINTLDADSLMKILRRN